MKNKGLIVSLSLTLFAVALTVALPREALGDHEDHGQSNNQQKQHAGELVRVLPAWRSAPVAAWAIFPERRLMPAKTRAFIDALAKALEPCREPGANVFTGCGEATPGALKKPNETT